MLHASSHTLMFSWTSNIPKYKTKHHVTPQGAKFRSLATNIIFFVATSATSGLSRSVCKYLDAEGLSTHPSIHQLVRWNALEFSTHPPKCCEAGNSSPSTCCRTAAEALIKGDQMWAGYGKCLNAPRFSFVTAARKSGEKNSFRVDVGDFENSLAWLVHDFDFNGWHCGSILLASSRIITNPFSIVQPCRKPQTQNKHNSHTN